MTDRALRCVLFIRCHFSARLRERVLVSCHVCDVALEFGPFLRILKGFRLTAQGCGRRPKPWERVGAAQPTPNGVVSARFVNPAITEGRNPVRGCVARADRCPRVASFAREPWAVRQKPFGLRERSGCLATSARLLVRRRSQRLATFRGLALEPVAALHT